MSLCQQLWCTSTRPASLVRCKLLADWQVMVLSDPWKENYCTPERKLVGHVWLFREMFRLGALWKESQKNENPIQSIRSKSGTFRYQTK
jgi:hypothetical protein